MKIDFKNIARKCQTVFDRISKGITTRGAIGISIIIHVLIGTALVSFFVGILYIQPAEQHYSIEFDLATEKLTTAFSGPMNSEASDKDGIAESETSKYSGKTGNLVKGNMSNEALYVASLASINDLGESFRFIMQKVSSDSLGGLSPIDGTAPGSEYDSFGNKKGEGFGSGHGAGIYTGGGFCAPSPAPRPGK